MTTSSSRLVGDGATRELYVDRLERVNLN